ncbi:MAG: hypothetical protein AAF363_18680 [Bacteroidota bacterium]
MTLNLFLWYVLAIPIICGLVYLLYELVTDLRRRVKGIADNQRSDWVRRGLAAVFSAVMNHYAIRWDCFWCLIPDWQSLWIMLTSGFLTASTFYLGFDYCYAVSINKAWGFLGTTKVHDRRLSGYNPWLVLIAKILLFALSVFLMLAIWKFN